LDTRLWEIAANVVQAVVRDSTRVPLADRGTPHRHVNRACLPDQGSDALGVIDSVGLLSPLLDWQPFGTIWANDYHRRDCTDAAFARTREFAALDATVFATRAALAVRDRPSSDLTPAIIRWPIERRVRRALADNGPLP
jgi:hypothetical protein